MRPICVKCQVSMPCIKTGFLVRHESNGVQSGDKYRCPNCGAEVVTSLGQAFPPESAERVASMAMEYTTGKTPKPVTV